MHAGGVLGPRFPRLQGVQTHACHDGRQAPAEVFDPIGSCTPDAHPGILNGFIGLREGAQHPICHRLEVSAGRGRWRVNGVMNADVTGCIDVDLSFTPATNLFTLRRLGLKVGEHADAPALPIWNSPGCDLRDSHNVTNA